MKKGTKLVIVPKIMNVIGDWFKNKLKEKLLPQLMDRYDEYFDIFGEHVIELQEKYNIKDYMDKILHIIEINFHIITGIQMFVIPILKDTKKKYKIKKILIN